MDNYKSDFNTQEKYYLPKYPISYYINVTQDPVNINNYYHRNSASDHNYYPQKMENNNRSDELKNLIYSPNLSYNMNNLNSKTGKDTTMIKNIQAILREL